MKLCIQVITKIKPAANNQLVTKRWNSFYSLMGNRGNNHVSFPKFCLPCPYMYIYLQLLSIYLYIN